MAISRCQSASLVIQERFAIRTGVKNAVDGKACCQSGVHSGIHLHSIIVKIVAVQLLIPWVSHPENYMKHGMLYEEVKNADDAVEEIA